MSREVIANGDRGHALPPVMLDDCRLQLPSDNIFRFCAQNGMPTVATDKAEEVSLLTAAEIEAARLTKKATKKK